MLKIFLLRLALGAFVQGTTFSPPPPLTEPYYVTNDHLSCNVYCFHLGADMVLNNGATAGAEVHSVCDGIVKEVTYRATSTSQNYGGRVLIECEDTPYGTVTVLYGHLGRNTTNPQTDDIFVSVGDSITAGQVIGRLGETSENGGWIPHLHFSTHRGAYLGDATECGRWTYAGYTAGALATNDPCYCAMLDNWIDPMEFLGVYPPELRVVAGSHTPEEGHPNDTQYTFHLSAVGGRNLPVSAQTLITNPVSGIEYPFAMRYIPGTGNPAQFEYTGRLQNLGEYLYRFKLTTCADSYEEWVMRIGPTQTPAGPACVPTREVCDGADNDCDSRIDEHAYIYCRTACGEGQKSCENGRLLDCNAPAPQNEVCDLIDNDCDGVTDEEPIIYRFNSCSHWIESCSGGELTVTSGTKKEPSPETCNNTDDDCDGTTDESMVRECATACGTGIEECFYGSWRNCSAPAPQTETCNNRDDDCDGATDEGVKNACGQCGQVPTETCNNRDDDCDGQTDESLTRSCTTACGTGTERCANGTWNSCNAPAPQTETCDNADNDCDGATDEGVKNACGQCGPAPAETCNDRDDDCDGLTDESLTRSCNTACGTGTQQCSYSNWSTCSAPAPQTEICDNRDNDCDGATDETLTQSCTNTCGNTGTKTCTAGNWGTCNATACPPPPPPPPVCTPTTEICDGADNDCDQQIDENLTRSCSNECGNTGTQTCSANAWGACNAATCVIADIPEPEVCDNIDNDLDAQTDEGLTQNCNNECGNTGTETCGAGSWSTCNAQPCCYPSTEVCDGLDNDCDRQVDENLTRSCSNTCGNTGTQTCSNNSWSACNATACPPPPPPPPEVPQVTLPPPNTAPADNYIKQVNFGEQAQTRIGWGPVSNAASYSYIVRYGGTNNTGAVVAEGATTNRYYYVSVPPSLYGTELAWQVRGLNSAGSPGPWTEPQSFFVSYYAGSVIQCNNSACPNQGAWYLVSRDMTARSTNAPSRLILDWISSACTNGRTPTGVPFDSMSGYSRSSRYNGCP